MNTKTDPALCLIAPAVGAILRKQSDETRKVFAKAVNASRTGRFFAFTYTNGKGETSRKVYRLGGDIGAKMERDRKAALAKFQAENPGVPVMIKPGSGKTNWIDQAAKTGVRGSVLCYNGNIYIRGTDTKSKEHRTIKLSGIKL